MAENFKENFEASNSYWPVPNKDEMLIATIGGVGEIGMNFTMYGHDGEWIIVDAGVGFLSHEEKKANNGVTGRTVSYETVADIAQNIKGLVVTHAHADHIEGIAPLLDYLKIPVYASPFACCLIKAKNPNADIREFIPGEDIELDEFHIKTIETTHSIPESVHLFITGGDMQQGVLHTGDWKFDLTNKNSKVDLDTLEELGSENRVGCVVGDSTNARREGKTLDEKSVIPAFEHIMANAKGAVYVCCFASNVDRVDNVINTAHEAGRVVAVSGRSMLNNVQIATDLGYVNGDILIPSDTLHSYDNSLRTLVMTGSQGEEGAILARLINQGVDSDNLNLPPLQYGDTLVMSSRTIPGNEEIVNELLDRYRAIGVRVITADGPDINAPEDDMLRKHPVHVSGHPAKDDLSAMYTLTSPTNVIPVHGHEKDMVANGEIAKAVAHSHVIIPRVGSVISMIDHAPIQEIGMVPVYQDEQRVIKKSRRRAVDYAQRSKKQNEIGM